MANTRISNLTASASNLASTDLAPVVQTAGVGPVKMTGLQLAGGLLGSTTFNGSTVTTSSPVLNLTQTWNAGAVTFTGLKFNATDTASASGSLLLDLQLGGSSQVLITKIGGITSSGNTVTTSGATGSSVIQMSSNSSYGFHMASGYAVTWGSGASLNGTIDLTLRRAAAATLQLGAADTTGTTAPTAQFLRVQSWSSSTNNDQTGANFTIQGSRGTGMGAGGSIIFQVAPAGSSGTAQNAYSTALTLNSAQQAVFSDGTVSLPSIRGSDADSGFFFRNSGTSLAYSLNASCMMQIDSGSLALKSNMAVAWSSGTPDVSGGDVSLYRDAANTLALRNGTNAQEFRVYGTTDGTNSEYGLVSADTGAVYFGHAKTGTGSVREIRFLNGGTVKWKIDTSGNFLANADNAVDIGASGANRPRNLYLGGSITLGGTNITGASGGTWGTPSVIQLAAGGHLQWNGRTRIYSAADGSITLYNNATTGFTSIQFGGTDATFPALKRISSGNCLQVIAADDTASAGFIVGNQALATSATDGFLYVPTCAGTPTGTPTTQTGTAPIIVDTTNNKLYFYSGGQWRDAGP